MWNSNNRRGTHGISRRGFVTRTAGLAGSAMLGAPALLRAQDNTSLRFAYEGPAGTAQETAANIFQETLEEASSGSMSIIQYPAAQLGAEPTLLRKVLSGDIDLVISSTANASQIAPQSGVFSLHYLFSDFEQVQTALKDPKLLELYQTLASDAVQGAQPISLFTLPLRNFFAAETEVHSVEDIQGQKIRVQATATEDRFFEAYGAVPVHMPFTEVYTSLQTGVIDMAENAITYYGSFKLYEVAPVVSMSQHEGNFQILWISDQAMEVLSDEQRGWLETAAAAVSEKEPALAGEAEDAIREEYESMGILFNDDVDKQSFIDIAEPLQSEIAESLGENAVAILDHIHQMSS